MNVEQQQGCLTLQAAEDILAGWRNMPALRVAYIRIPPRDSVTPFYVVGVFECQEGEVVKGQRKVTGLTTGVPVSIGAGVNLIAHERFRQVTVEGFAPDHDASHHKDESMATVAACYASPDLIYEHIEGPDHELIFQDPWPRTWAKHWDKRGKHDRIHQLAIAGALCAAEIDRLITRQNRNDYKISPKDSGYWLTASFVKRLKENLSKD